MLLEDNLGRAVRPLQVRAVGLPVRVPPEPGGRSGRLVHSHGREVVVLVPLDDALSGRPTATARVTDSRIGAGGARRRRWQRGRNIPVVWLAVTQETDVKSGDNAVHTAYVCMPMDLVVRNHHQIHGPFLQGELSCCWYRHNTQNNTASRRPRRGLTDRLGETTLIKDICLQRVIYYAKQPGL